MLCAWMAKTRAWGIGPVNQSLRSFILRAVWMATGIEQPCLESMIHRLGFRCVRPEKLPHVVKRKAGTDDQYLIGDQGANGPAYFNVLGGFQRSDQGELNTGYVSPRIHDFQWDKKTMIEPSAVIKPGLNAGITE